MRKNKFLIFMCVLSALVAASWGISPSWAARRIPKKQWNKIVKRDAPPETVSWRNQAWFEVQKAKIERNKLILKEQNKKGK